MSRIHAWLGAAIVLAFLVLSLWGLVLRILRREDAPTGFRLVQYWTENLLALQIVLGIIFLFMGRRVTGTEDAILHYFYGSLFPLIAVVGGRIAALRREKYPYVGMAWGAFFAFGLVIRAMMTGCQGVLSWSCLTG
jgi:hypothetical protein